MVTGPFITYITSDAQWHNEQAKCRIMVAEHSGFQDTWSFTAPKGGLRHITVHSYYNPYKKISLYTYLIHI